MTTSIDPALTPHESSVNEPSWYYDEGVAGSGDRPDWLPEKFKSVADAARSYTELEKRVGSAPKEYDVSKGESWIDPDYAPFQDLLDFAKQKHVSQDVVDKMLDSVGKYLDEFKIDYTQEKQKLGDRAEERLQTLDNWMKSNFSKEAYEAMTNNLRTADSVKALEEMRSKMNSTTTTIPNSNHEQNASIPSLQDIQSEMNNNLEKYKKDPAYRAQLQTKMELAARTSGFEDKRAY